MRSAVILAGVLCAGCSASGLSGRPAPASPTSAVELFTGTAPWAYRLGPEVYARRNAGNGEAREQLTEQALLHGCQALVMVRLPDMEGQRTESPASGICAYRLDVRTTGTGP